MSGKEFVLPLYFIRRQTRFSLNEKKLVIFLLSTSLATLLLIFSSLPPNSQFNGDELNKFFVPKLNNSKIIHQENLHNHEINFKNKKLGNDNQKPMHDVRPEIDAKNLQRRETVKNMTLLAWNGYKKYAWGQNELKPIRKSAHQPGIFGNAVELGASIVDSLDTLHIMGLDEEVKLGYEWIKQKFNFKVNTQMSAFETNIRFVGGFLAMYALTNDKLYLDKAVEVADSLMPIFNSPTGIPYSLFNPVSKTVSNYNWAAGSCSILAEIGTISLEFQYLTDMTGNKIYQEKIDKIYDTLLKNKNQNGLYYNYINPSTGQYCGSQASIGGLADSFYEYLLKFWLYKKKADKNILKMYLDSIDALKSHVYSKSKGNLGYFGEYSNNYVTPKMGHLACFAGGMFALTAIQVDELSEEQKKMYKDMAIDITNTCHESYIRTATHLGPESFSFDSTNEAYAADKYYILRPEVIESYFYLWRITKDEKYRDWAWDAVEAIEKYCKTENGYSGISDVNSPNPNKDDVQQSFFLAETLKYLYLIFSDDDAISLDKYVFNTEAHPFPIRN
ncbi:unnamed protein product [Brachionus calyciflorus]|uniref:alpha-1,2-Mannosidase n=1 Tax=Brachionus calyciflorus TaxID=104777 RepID=A0A813URL0_9BILA|nr:unnamed protein product [Brachionus calyciflorus]